MSAEISDEPSESPTDDSPSLWQRATAVLVPFLGGILFIAGIEHANNSETVWALVKFGMAAFLVVTAWRWTK